MPWPSSCRTTVTKSIVPAGGAASVPKYQLSRLQLRRIRMSVSRSNCATKSVSAMALACAMGYHVLGRPTPAGRDASEIIARGPALPRVPLGKLASQVASTRIGISEARWWLQISVAKVTASIASCGHEPQPPSTKVTSNVDEGDAVAKASAPAWSADVTWWWVSMSELPSVQISSGFGAGRTMASCAAAGPAARTSRPRNNASRGNQWRMGVPVGG